MKLVISIVEKILISIVLGIVSVCGLLVGTIIFATCKLFNFLMFVSLVLFPIIYTIINWKALLNVEFVSLIILALPVVYIRWKLVKWYLK